MYVWRILGSGKLALICKPGEILRRVHLVAKWETQEGAEGSETGQLLQKLIIISLNNADATDKSRGERTWRKLPKMQWSQGLDFQCFLLALEMAARS